MIIYKHSLRIDFSTKVDWREKQDLLKVAFPVLVRSTKAVYEIQFGNVERPTHWNTSWDWAKFETAAQRWCDLSEGNYGISLLNDCKYGHDIHNHVMRLSLIKSATYPDPNADQGHHEFTYSLLPHKEGWLEAKTHRHACELNTPLIVSPLRKGRSTLAPILSFGLISCDSDHVMVDTLKKAEVGDDLIVRLYEYGNCRSTVKIRVGAVPGKRFVSVEETDLLENPLGNDSDFYGEADGGGTFTFDLNPYEIKTFRLKWSLA